MVCVVAAAQSVTVSNLGANQVTLNFTAESSGTGYFTLLNQANPICGSAAQTKSGQDSASNVVLGGSVALTANTTDSYTVRNLAGSTGYTVCFTPDGVTAPTSTTLTTNAGNAFANASWSPVGSQGFSPGSANYTSLAFSPDGTPYVAYSDAANSGKATVMEYSGGAWIPVGSPDFSAGEADFLSLAFAPDGTPYVAYSDAANNGNATVMTYRGGAWTTVGDIGFSAGLVNYLSLSISPNGTPYVSYQDYSNGMGVTVMQFNGSAWATVGNVGFSSGPVQYTSLAFSPAGVPYVAYQDYNNGSKATVMQFNRSTGQWMNAGNADFSAAEADYLSLAFSPSGVPYVAFMDAANRYKATVMQLNSTTGQWTNVGKAGLSWGVAQYTSLSFSPSGAPTVAYADLGKSQSVTVRQFNSATGQWMNVGQSGLSAGGANYLSLSFAPDGTPYVAYSDSSVLNGAATLMKLINPPTATTGSASNVTGPSATLNGMVNDNDAATTVSFDYGTTASYGSNVAATTPVGGAIRAGSGSTAVSLDLTGLATGTTYHYRVDAIANGITAYGADATFTTLALPVVSSVSPADGPAVGGTTVKLTGSGFTNANIVSFGSKAATSFSVLSDTQIMAVSPSGAGAESIFVTTAGGTNEATAASQFIYNAPVESKIATNNLGANQVTLNFTTSASGTGYFTLLNEMNPTCGSASQTMAGQDSAGNAVLNGSLPLTANTTTSYTVRKLAASTSYTVCFTPDGVTVPSSTTLTTNAGITAVGAGWSSVGEPDFSAGEADYLSLAFAPDGTPYVAYSDAANNKKATVLAYSAGAWSAVGSPDFSAGEANFLSLAFAPDGTPYVAYADALNNNRATVMMYSAGAWVSVGNPNISAGEANYLSLAFAPDGTPYLAYSDAPNSSRATVMMYSAGTWVSVGNPDISAGEADFLSLAFAPSGAPYLAYSDAANNKKTTVMAYNGASWISVGSPDFSAGEADFLSLAFAPSGAPYLAYSDAANNKKTTVMTYNGGSWINVGSSGFSTEEANYTSLAFAPDGTPYLAYAGATSSGKTTVTAYSDGSWVSVGSQTPLAGSANSVALAFSLDGTPYLAYADESASNKATVVKLTSLPSAITGSASDLTSTSATLNGTIQDNGIATVASFDYGTTSSYGTNVVATTPNTGAIHPGSGSTAISAGLTGLAQGTVYHYRLDATANGTTVYGADATFTTEQLVPTVAVNAASASYDSAPLSLSASVSYAGQNPPTGAFTFQVGTGITVTATCTGASSPLHCTAQYPISTLAVNNYTINGALAADRLYAAANNSATLTVNKATTSITTVPSASSLTYGQQLYHSLLSGGVASTPGSFAWTTPNITPSVGNESYAIVFTPSDTHNYSAATEVIPVKVNQAGVSNVSLSSSVNPIMAQNATTLTATVLSTIATPTGMVSFFDGSNLLGTAALLNGATSIRVSSLTVGTHTITAIYSGDENFTGATSNPVSEQVQDFALNLSPSAVKPQTISTGGTASYSFSLDPIEGNTFASQINLSVSGLPAGATYQLSPQSIAAGTGATSVKLMITMAQQSKTASLPTGLFRGSIAPVAFGLFLLPFFGRIRKKAKRLTQFTALLLLLAACFMSGTMLTGCGASNGFNGETAKSYIITITGTSGETVHSSNLYLTVKQ